MIIQKPNRVTYLTDADFLSDAALNHTMLMRYVNRCLDRICIPM